MYCSQHYDRAVEPDWRSLIDALGRAEVACHGTWIATGATEHGPTIIDHQPDRLVESLLVAAGQIADNITEWDDTRRANIHRLAAQLADATRDPIDPQRIADAVAEAGEQ